MLARLGFVTDLQPWTHVRGSFLFLFLIAGDAAVGYRAIPVHRPWNSVPTRSNAVRICSIRAALNGAMPGCVDHVQWRTDIVFGVELGMFVIRE